MTLSSVFHNAPHAAPRITPDACIACTACVAHCPVAAATTHFSGPRLLGPAWERFRLSGLAEDPSLHHCANCKNCDMACPHGVRISSLHMLARAAQCRRQSPGLRDWLLAHGDLTAAWLRHIPAWLKNFGMNNPLSRALLDVLGIDRRAPLPPFAPRSFQELFAGLRQPRHARRVVFYPGCYVQVYDPQAGLDIVWALNRAGYAVIVPDTLVCCGLPLVANGFWQDARRRAAHNLRLLAGWRDRGLPVLGACPSCVLMFRVDLGEYFPDLAAAHGSCAVQDAGEFLLAAAHRGELPLTPLRGPSGAAEATAAPPGIPRRVLYHAPCHLRAQGIGLPGLRLLHLFCEGRTMAGLRVDNADAGCCGICGSYGFKREKYDLARRMGEALFARVRACAPDVLVSECGTCRVQLAHAGGTPCLHPLSLLRQWLEGRP